MSETKLVVARELIRGAIRAIFAGSPDCRHAEQDFTRLAEEELLLACAQTENGLRFRSVAWEFEDTSTWHRTVGG